MNSTFIFVVCQSGAEAVCKQEILANHAGLNFAFSRPGFLTFKKTDESTLADQFHLKSTFARTFGWSLGSHTCSVAAELIEPILNFEQTGKSQHLHVWQRDLRVPGAGGFEPGPSVLADEIGGKIAAAVNEKFKIDLPVNRHARSGDAVLDIVMVEPNNWWYGFHLATSKQQRWPGGVPNLAGVVEVEPISRARFKLGEALLWSGIHIQAGDVCMEIGSSPGGGCQLLLEKGAKVIAVDPAELDPQIAEHENLTHFRCRGRELRKRELKDVRWLISDMNVTPNYTLDTVTDLVSNQHARRIRGLILTLKLSDLKLAGEIPKWKQRVKSLGFSIVKTRQLAFNRREFCLIAIRDRFAQRVSRQAPQS